MFQEKVWEVSRSLDTLTFQQMISARRPHIVLIREDTVCSLIEIVILIDELIRSRKGRSQTSIST